MTRSLPSLLPFALALNSLPPFLPLILAVRSLLSFLSLSLAGSFVSSFLPFSIALNSLPPFLPFSLVLRFLPSFLPFPIAILSFPLLLSLSLALRSPAGFATHEVGQGKEEGQEYGWERIDYKTLLLSFRLEKYSCVVYFGNVKCGIVNCNSDLITLLLDISDYDLYFLLL